MKLKFNGRCPVLYALTLDTVSRVSACRIGHQPMTPDPVTSDH